MCILFSFLSIKVLNKMPYNWFITYYKCMNYIAALDGATKHHGFSDLPFSNARQLLDLRHDLSYLKLQSLWGEKKRDVKVVFISLS